MAKGKTEIWSIYGQIDEVVARAMIEEGKFNQLPVTTIPPSQLFNDKNERIRLAVVVPAEWASEYYRRVAALRA